MPYRAEPRATPGVAIGHPIIEPEGLPMTRETTTRTQIAILIYMMTNGVLFGAGIVLVLSWPALSVNAGFWISAVVAVSLILAAPVAWWIAPRLRARYWRLQTAADHAGA